MTEPADNLTVTRGIGLDEAVIEFEKWYIWWTLERNSFNQSRTAAELKIHRNSLVSRIHDWGWKEKVQDGYRGKSVTPVHD